MTQKMYRELVEGDVFVIAGREFVVASEPVTERGITRWNTATVSGKLLGPASSISTDEVDVLRNVSV